MSNGHSVLTAEQVTNQEETMKLIEPSVELITESNPYKLVERIGRTCYKSEDKITEDSCYKFVKGLIERQHFAMLEHARFSFLITGYDACLDGLANIPGVNYSNYDIVEPQFILNVSMSHLYNPKWQDAKYGSVVYLFETLRKIVECEYVPGTEEYYVDGIVLQNVNRNDFQYATIKFVCDRGVSHELVRHRCAVAQESTRYCNYTKEKFGGGDISFVYPSEYDSFDVISKQSFEVAMNSSEFTYNMMIDHGCSPQQARAVLPNALKTEVILTMNLEQWKHFFDLRYFGITGAPHPDMKKVAGMAYNLLSTRI